MKISDQLKKKGVEVRRNAEFQAVLNGAGSAANEAGTPDGLIRRFGSLPTWAANATSGGSAASAGAANGSAIPTYTGTGAFTRGLVESTIADMYVDGGKPNMLMTSARRRTKVSAVFSSDTATGAANLRRLESMEKKLNISIATVVADFGVEFGIVANYVMDHANTTAAADVMYMFDSSKIKKAVLRPLNVGKLDDNGDGKRAIITEECTLEVMNPNAVAVIGGLTNA